MKFSKYFLILLFPAYLHCQTVTSPGGFLFVPTAKLNPDRTFSIGTTYFQKNTLGYFNGKYNSLFIYADMTFLPFLSVGVNIMRPLDYPVNIYGAGDRSVTFKLQLLKEESHYLNLLIGMQDALHIINFDTRTNTDFNSAYVVLSKKINFDAFGKSELEISSGYAKKRSIATFYDMNGFFGGVKVKVFSKYSFILEYDSRFTNAGLNFSLFDAFNIMAGTRSWKSVFGSVSYSFIL